MSLNWKSDTNKTRTTDKSCVARTSHILMEITQQHIRFASGDRIHDTKTQNKNATRRQHSQS